LQQEGARIYLSSIQDITETGTVTYNWNDPITASVTIKNRGLQQFRLDAVLPDGQQSTVINGGSGLQTDANGTVRAISRQSLSDLACTPFPYQSFIQALQDSSVSIVSNGLLTHNGASVYDVRIQKNYSADQDPEGNRGIREARDFYIDPNTFLVVSISDRLYSDATTSQSIVHEILYSNYQTENGVAMPLTISETLDGNTGVTLQLSQVTFNTGLTDSAFNN
jgi:hypothetical protein